MWVRTPRLVEQQDNDQVRSILLARKAYLVRDE